MKIYKDVHIYGLSVSSFPMKLEVYSNFYPKKSYVTLLIKLQKSSSAYAKKPQF